MTDSMTSSPSPVKACHEHRPRRSHKKSRNGCFRCKARRIKCDEAKPKCSRCTKMTLTCQYPPRQGVSEEIQAAGNLEEIRSPESTSPATSSRNSTPPTENAALTYELALEPRIAKCLGPTEFELLKHYLEHTSIDPTMNENDQYAVQVGIPNLACHCSALMHSMLAMAALCKCSDILHQPLISQQDRALVIEWLSLSHRYHMEALRRIQVSLHQTTLLYDHVLANAAMMGMYGSGSHAVRIWLVKTAPPGSKCDFFMPRHPQWISLYRAVDLAYAGLLNNNNPSSQSSSSTTSASQSSSSSFTSSGTPAASNGSSPGREPQQPPPIIYNISPSYQEPRVASTTLPHPLAPLLSATISTALFKLSARVHQVSSSFLFPSPELKYCLSALGVLSKVISDIFPPADADAASTSTSAAGAGSGAATSAVPARPTPPTPPPDTTPVPEVLPLGKLKEVSPWMRKYIAGITSVFPSPLPRRTIPAFIHKVPAGYLKLVEDVFEIIGRRPKVADVPATKGEEYFGGGGGGGAFSSWGLGGQEEEEDGTTTMMDMMDMMEMGPVGLETDPETMMSVEHELALEIFAHWLVLFIMLDGVWWIGGIGAWELGRVVEFRRRKRRGRMGGLGLGLGVGMGMGMGWGGAVGGGEELEEEVDEDWWPESMWEVSRQFDKHRVDGA